MTFRELISINIGLSASGWPGTNSVIASIGGGQVGLRALPLIEFHLTPVWPVDFNAEVSLYAAGSAVKTSQTYLAGFTATGSRCGRRPQTYILFVS